MEFQKRLLEVDRALGEAEVRAMVYLCSDLLGLGPAALRSAADLFCRLSDQDLLSEENQDLLSELLLTIQRPRLLRDLGLARGPQTNLISSYRKLMYRLSEELTDDDLKSMKFLLTRDLSRKKLNGNCTTLEVFIELEQMDLISESNLSLLEKIIGLVCPALVEKIKKFKEEQAESHGPIAEEMLELPYPQQSTQVPFNQLHCTSETAVSMFSERAMSPAAGLLHPFNEEADNEAASPEPSDLCTETNSRASVRVRRDVLASFPNNHGSSGSATSVMSNANSDLETYRMTAAKRGICFIINNKDFCTTNLSEREGTMVDEESLVEVFRWLCFEIKIQQNCKSQQMLTLMEELAASSQPEWDSVVCCVLSHGVEGRVYGVDGKTVHISKLMEPFTGKKCPALAGKPKLFFIQACQGSRHQDAVYLESDNSNSSLSNNAAKDCIPSHADFLLGLATIPSFVSYRHKQNGTWYIQSLCYNLVRMVPSGSDLISILTKVNADVSKKCDDTGFKKQMPQPAFTLTKKLIFPVPKGSIPVFRKLSTS